MIQGRIQHLSGVGSSPRYRRSDHEAPPKPPLQICIYSSLEGEARDEKLWDKFLLTYFLDPPLFQMITAKSKRYVGTDMKVHVYFANVFNYPKIYRNLFIMGRGISRLFS
jgi:small basic protein